MLVIRTEITFVYMDKLKTKMAIKVQEDLKKKCYNEIELIELTLRRHVEWPNSLDEFWPCLFEKESRERL